MKFHRLPHPTLSLLAFALAIVAATPALAGPANKVYRPVVEKGETEFELRGGYRDFAGSANEYATVFDVGYGVTDRWQTELVLEYSGLTGQGGKLEAMEWENVFVLTEQGKHWIDVGLLVEYEHRFASGPDELKVGPLFMKEIGPTIANLNLIFERQVGPGASSDIELDYAWEVKWRGTQSLEWGVQGFGGLGKLDNVGQDDSHSIGPALFGKKRLASGNKLGFDAAVLAGINDAAPDVTVRFELEYEMY